MTAFNDILTVEHEAELAIETAKEEVAAAVEVAHSEHKTRLEVELLKLHETEQSVLTTHQIHIDNQIKNIQSDITAQIAAVESRFATRQVTLKSAIKQSF